MKSNLKILMFLLILISCKKETKQNVIDENYCGDELEIIIDQSRILINREGRFGNFEITKTLNNKQLTETKSFKLTQSEIDKLFTSAFNLITLDSYTIHTKSCYAGQHFILKLNCINKSIEFHESSVENWSKISKETKEISRWRLANSSILLFNS